MKVLVTGSTGFIGLNLVHKLQTTNSFEPLTLVRESSQTEMLPAGVETVYGDLTQPGSFEDGLRRADALIHLAAVYPGYDNDTEQQAENEEGFIREVNVSGTQLLLERAADHNIETVVFTSTINAHPDLYDDTVDNQYVITKYEADQEIVHGDWPFDWSIIHPTYVIGPRDYRLNHFNLFQRVAANRLLVPPLYIPGQYNIVHVFDVVDTLRTALNEIGTNRFVVSGENHSASTLYRTIAAVADDNCFVPPIPRSVVSIGLSPIVNRLHNRGLYPINGAEFRSGVQRGTVPERFTNAAPAKQRSLRTTVKDAYNWYQSVGVL
ncbi:NAD-dependent epimerase/dehydratase family protein [Halobellus rubicundus]|uniref:NAD-dependent epimerase/dehydratase family protein n=1 Tax=Halobellus rubicundus TaxID=2996466 RepID=A0ABD5ME77_9EURY